TMSYHADGEPDARSVTMAVSMRAVGERAGHPHGFCGVCVDISRLKQDQDRLSDAEQTFSQVFQAIPDASIVVKLYDRTPLEVNSAFLDLTGYARHEIVGNNIMMLANWEDLDDLNSFLALFEVDSGTTTTSALRCRDRGVLPVRCVVRDIDSAEEKYRLLVIRSIES
ncbi:MAG TPA: PAS domain S-box protein, partial [Spirochaetia bacterium]|nr:PAS domain S-box protein [Spirochaetia bacterium]